MILLYTHLNQGLCHYTLFTVHVSTDTGGVSQCIFSFCVLISRLSGAGMKTTENTEGTVPGKPVLYISSRTVTTPTQSGELDVSYEQVLPVKRQPSQ